MARAFDRLRASVTAKVLFIGFLVVLLLVPMGMIEGLIRDRNHLYHAAKREIMASWGGEQTVGGPVLTVPYRAVVRDEEGRARETTRFAHFLPRRLAYRGELDPQVRRRGIHEVPVYTARLRVSGHFDAPRPQALGIGEGDVAWDDARLSVSVSDPRAIKSPVRLRSPAGEATFEPAGRIVAGAGPQIAVALPGLAERHGERGEEGGFEFSYELTLGGTAGLRLLPMGDRTEVALSSSWPSPSFAGAYLPERYDIDSTRFGARWNVLHLGRGYPSRWRADAVSGKSLAASAFGVDLFVPVSTYRMSMRAAKYAVLFIGLTFLAYFMFEVFGALALHPFQYLLVGFANCCFYLLLLSLSEHVAFGLAYALSALAAASLVVGYSASVLRARGRAASMLALMGGLYGFLYVTLRAEDYAMLIGSIGLLAILAAVMYLTRSVDWYAVTLDATPPPRAQATPSR